MKRGVRILIAPTSLAIGSSIIVSCVTLHDISQNDGAMVRIQKIVALVALRRGAVVQYEQ